jgi:hypothetical protein
MADAAGKMVTRRSFLGSAIKIAGLWTIITAGLSRNAFAANLETDIKTWAARIQEESARLRAGAITDARWRDALDELTAHIAIEDVLQAIDFNRLKTETPFAEKGVSTARVALPGFNGKRLAFTSKIFAIGPGRAIIPHGHENMISAHLVLDGEMRLRQYDKLAREHNTLLIEPSVDKIIGPGAISSISLTGDNIHWMTTETGAWTLDIILTNINEKAEKAYDIFNLDMDAAAPSAGGALRAPIIGVADALRKYG